ncbi:MAG: hypothetical protein JNM81_08920 [Rhodospirillaceae bacterium]|nr:hypothetical protein [Rhodospirillaceae bacterium]
MRFTNLTLAAAFALALPMAAVAQPTDLTKQPAAEEVSIPFVQFGAIRDWRPDGREGLYVQGNGDQWYYAKLMSPCTGLNFADVIAFNTKGGANQLDRFSSIIVDGQTCQFKSLVKSEKPVSERKRKDSNNTDSNKM